MKTLKLGSKMKVVDLRKAGPDPEAYHHAGPHSDENGPFEVFWVDNPHNDREDEALAPGWYWWSCHPGCLPDGDAHGPFDTSRAAYDEATDADAEPAIDPNCLRCSPFEQCPRSGFCPNRR